MSFFGQSGTGDLNNLSLFEALFLGLGAGKYYESLSLQEGR